MILVSGRVTSALLNIMCFKQNVYPGSPKNQTLPHGTRRESFWIILKTILCLVLDSQGRYIYILYIYIYMSIVIYI